MSSPPPPSVCFFLSQLKQGTPSALKNVPQGMGRERLGKLVDEGATAAALLLLAAPG